MPFVSFFPMLYAPIKRLVRAFACLCVLPQTSLYIFINQIQCTHTNRQTILSFDDNRQHLGKFYFIFTADKNEFTECLLKRCDRSNIITLHNKYLIDKKKKKN